MTTSARPVYQATANFDTMRLIDKLTDISSGLHNATACLKNVSSEQHVSGGTLNTWRSGDDGRTVAERLQVRF
jgi:hypothetical protein